MTKPTKSQSSDQTRASTSEPRESSRTKTASSRTKKGDSVRLLSGGNPQIPKGDGDEPVQQYIAAMPGWKHDIGRRLDALIVRDIPHVKKAVRWNSPFYGIEGQGWLVSFHVLTRYVQVNFFCGSSLQPEPPGSGKDPKARWLNIYEGEDLDENQLSDWLQQASKLSGWASFSG